MKVFLDTSSFIKIYHKENGSDELIKYLSKAERVYLTKLSKLEFRSGIWKKVRTQEIPSNKGKEILTIFKKDEKKYSWIAIRKEIFEISKKMLDKYGIKGLRSLDSIQLSTALYIKSGIDPDIVCSTYDTLLKGFMENENLIVK